MRPKILNISPYLAADDDAIALAQQPSAGGIQEFVLTSDPDPFVMDFPRQVDISLSSDDRDRTIVVTGTDRKGNLLVEAVALKDSDNRDTVHAFATVTSVKIDDDPINTISVGFRNTVSTNWLPLDYMIADFKVALGITVHSTVTADVTVELTLFNLLDWQGYDVVPVRGSHVRSEFERFYPDRLSGPFTVGGISVAQQRHIFDHDTLVNVTDDATGNIAFPVRAVRLISNVPMTGGSADSPGVDLEVIQASHGR